MQLTARVQTESGGVELAKVVESTADPVSTTHCAVVVAVGLGKLDWQFTVAVTASVKKPVGYTTYILDPVPRAVAVVNVAVAPLLAAPGVAEGMLSEFVMVTPADIAGKVTGIHTVEEMMLFEPTVTTPGTTLLLLENMRPLIVTVVAVVPAVMGTIAPVTARVTVRPAKVGVTRAEPMLKTSMPEDVTEKVLPKVTVREDPAAIAVFIKNEITTLEQGPILQEETAAEVTIKPDRGPVGAPELVRSKLVPTVMPLSVPAVAAPVVSPVTVTVCAPAASAPVPASVMTPELKLKKV